MSTRISAPLLTVIATPLTGRRDLAQSRAIEDYVTGPWSPIQLLKRGPEMATIDVTDENFQEVTGRDGIVILDFWATWCGACRAFAPVYEAASEEHPDIVFGKVDTEAAAQLSSEIGIRALPTVAVYRDSIRVFFQAGALPKPALADLIAQVRGLDMEQVRAELDNHQHEPGHVHA